MTVISGVLTAPDGSALPSVSINLKALATSTAVVAQLESETVTDANGNYSISAEVGQYQVTISAYGQPDKLVGNIQIYADSVNGTLNDFLTTPGEDALTPVIVATVEQMRADSQAAAALAAQAVSQVDQKITTATANVIAQATMQADRSEAAADSGAALNRAYLTMALAQAAITAGTIPNDGLFSTISTDPSQTYLIWQNANGTPTAVIDPSTGAQKTYPSGAAVDAVATSVDLMNSKVRVVSDDQSLLAFVDGSDDQILLGEFQPDGTFQPQKWPTEINSLFIRVGADINDGSGDLIQICDSSDDQILLFRCLSNGRWIGVFDDNSVFPARLENAASQSSAALSTANEALSATGTGLRSKLQIVQRSAQISNPINLGSMANPPTITYPASATAALTRQYNVTDTNNIFTLGGGAPYIYSSAFWRTYAVTKTEGRSQRVSRVSFMTDADVFELRAVTTASTLYRLLIDGQFVDINGASTGGTSWNINVSLGSRKARRIDFEYMQDSAFGRVSVGPTCSCWAVDTRNRVKIAVLGDSYSTGTGASASPTLLDSLAWCNVMGYLLGGVDIDIWQCAIGGTGYVNNASTEYTFGQHLIDLDYADPDIVIFAGGINDAGQAGIQAAALAAFQSARTHCPDAPIIILGSWSGSTGPSANILAAEASIKAAFDQWDDNNSFFIPVSTDISPWVFGTGRTGAVAGNGNADVYIGATTGVDATHPNALGHTYIGQRAALAISKILASI